MTPTAPASVHREKLDRWGLLWSSQNARDGKREYLLWNSASGVLLMFRTRQAARNFADSNYGYIKRSHDLRMEPHGWNMPRPVKLTTIEWTR